MRKIGAVAITLILCVGTAHAAGIEKRTVQSKDRARTYYLFVPDSVSPEHPAPLLVLLHGSGRDGKSQVNPWRNLAAREGIILAAPDSSDTRMWGAPQDGPVLLRDVVEDVKSRNPVDEKRVYLFGHSAGASFSLQMGSFESEYFAAVALHAGSMNPAFYMIFDQATRKIPFGIWVGDRDPYFSVDAVRATHDELVRRGFEAPLTIMPRHDHDYYGVASKLNEEIWSFLKKFALSQPQKFTSYGNM